MDLGCHRSHTHHAGRSYNTAHRWTLDATWSHIHHPGRSYNTTHRWTLAATGHISTILAGLTTLLIDGPWLRPVTYPSSWQVLQHYSMMDLGCHGSHTHHPGRSYNTTHRLTLAATGHISIILAGSGLTTLLIDGPYNTTHRCAICHISSIIKEGANGG